MKPRLILYMALFFFLALGTAAHAQSYRCSGILIKKGDTKADLIKNCGDPDDFETIVSSSRGAIVRRQKLLYDLGERKVVVTIASGVITEIREFVSYPLSCRGRKIEAGESKDFLIENCDPPFEVQQIVFGEEGSPDRGERLIYKIGHETVIVVIKDDAVLFVATER